ncbi:MAG TPA: hypothetical protein VFU15_06550 [Bacteroidia bacterium]|nr:hypothetical protein [Bacteroidia bacterium]
MRRITLLMIVFLAAGKIFAQVDDQTQTQTVKVNSNVYDDTKLLYRNERCGGLVIHSSGFGFDFRRGWHVTGAKKRVLEFELVNFRNIKEVKVSNPYLDHPKGYYYGKLNSLAIFRPGVGYQQVIFSKPEKNGVEIRYVTFVGMSLGFAKPVYLEILEDTPQQQVKIVVTEKYDPAKHFVDNIYGRAPWPRGLGETKIYPGGYAKFGFNFEYGALDDDVKSIEVGLCVDAYPKVIPLMANEHNHQVLLSLYLNFSYGHKWF